MKRQHRRYHRPSSLSIYLSPSSEDASTRKESRRLAAGGAIFRTKKKHGGSARAKKFVEDAGRRKAGLKINISQTQIRKKKKKTNRVIKRTLRLSESLRSPRPRRWLSHLSVSPTLDRWFPQTAARRSTRRSKCTRRRRGRCTSTRGVDFGATKARSARGKFRRCSRRRRRFSSSSPSFLFVVVARTTTSGARTEPSVSSLFSANRGKGAFGNLGF